MAEAASIVEIRVWGGVLKLVDSPRVPTAQRILTVRNYPINLGVRGSRVSSTNDRFLLWGTYVEAWIDKAVDT